MSRGPTTRRSGYRGADALPGDERRSRPAVPPPAAELVPLVAAAGSLPSVPPRAPDSVRTFPVPAPAAEVVPVVALAGSLPNVPVPGTVRSVCCVPAPAAGLVPLVTVGGPLSIVPVPGTVRSVACVPTGAAFSPSAGDCAVLVTVTLAVTMPARSAKSNLFINVPLEKVGRYERLTTLPRPSRVKPINVNSLCSN